MTRRATPPTPRATEEAEAEEAEAEEAEAEEAED